MRNKGISKTIAALVVGGLLGLTSLAVAPSAQADATTVETALLDAINRGRAAVGKPALQMHDGLRQVQRTHAADMAASGRLTHDGVEGRFTSATPVPAETNGPVDDGFSCWGENVAQNNRQGRTDEQVAAAIYEQWFNSPGHKSNMLDETGFGFNVAGVGIYEGSDGRIWAALLLAKDATPPTGSTGGSDDGDITPGDGDDDDDTKRCTKKQRRRGKCRRRS
jgi:uncharacterized protein YkwD